MFGAQSADFVGVVLLNGLHDDKCQDVGCVILDVGGALGATIAACAIDKVSGVAKDAPKLRGQQRSAWKCAS